MVEENEHGFDRALEQIRALYLDMDISKVDFCKEVVDGQSVGEWISIPLLIYEWMF